MGRHLNLVENIGDEGNITEERGTAAHHGRDIMIKGDQAFDYSTSLMSVIRTRGMVVVPAEREQSYMRDKLKRAME